MTCTARRALAAAALTSALAACGRPRADAPREVADFAPSAPRTHVEHVTAARQAWEVVLGGTLGAEDTTTRERDGVRVAFQPNLSLALENVGTTTVLDPRVTIGGRGLARDVAALAAQATEGLGGARDRALGVWDLVRSSRHHAAPVFGDGESNDPVKLLHAYGFGLCDDSGAAACALLAAAGFDAPPPRLRSLHGHVMGEVFYGGAWRFLDVDQEAFYLDRENEDLVGAAELARDHELVAREHAFGPRFQGWDAGARRVAPLFGADDAVERRDVPRTELHLRLRPGEAIEYRWTGAGTLPRGVDGAGRGTGEACLTYAPRLDAPGLAEDAARAQGVEPGGDGGLVASAAGGEVEWVVESPYPVCSARLALEGDGEVLVSLDGALWTRVLRGAGEANLDAALQVDRAPAKYAYRVRVQLLGGARLRALRVETTGLCSPPALPDLRRGANAVVYEDATEGAREVRVTHRFRESDAPPGPAPPARPLAPEPDAVVRASKPVLRWPSSEDAVRTHVRVSRTPDLRLPYRPSFDVVVEGTELGSPFQGLFSPGVDYWWAVRAQDARGVWGDWSPAWRFRWEGPRVPVGLAYAVLAGGAIELRWRPNPRGPRPVAYDVYGSDERGFALAPAAYVGRFEGTACTVAGPDVALPNANRSHYRVVAVDAHATQSGPSDLVELPHPHVVSEPVAEAFVGRPYRYDVRTLASLGDLQRRYGEPRTAYFEREAYAFELREGPAWLALGADGRLHGTPGRRDVGEGRVTLAVQRRYPDEVPASAERGAAFQKRGPRFEREAVQSFVLRVRAAGSL